MKIIVVQNEKSLLGVLKAIVIEFNPECINEIIFTSFPLKVLKEVKDQGVILVISGQKFDNDINGVELASKVKSINPNALFYIYSSVHESSDDVDGYISKDGRKGVEVAKIIASNLDVESVKGMLSTISEN